MSDPLDEVQDAYDNLSESQQEVFDQWGAAADGVSDTADEFMYSESSDVLEDLSSGGDE